MFFSYQANGDGDAEVGLGLVIGQFGTVPKKQNKTRLKKFLLI